MLHIGIDEKAWLRMSSPGCKPIFVRVYRSRGRIRMAIVAPQEVCVDRDAGPPPHLRHEKGGRR